MAFYVHWLDGEYIKILKRLVRQNGSGFTAPSRHSPLRTAETILKLRALLGANIVLSDAQLVDSEVVLRLFGDPNFRALLREESTFMPLVADAESPKHTSAFSRATAGLRAATRPKWMTSAFARTEPVVALAHAILEAGELDIERWRRDRSIRREFALGGPADERLLSGLLHGLAHYSNCSAATPTAPRGYRISFYDILEKTMTLGPTPQDAEAIATTLKFINREIDDPVNRHFRSRLQKKLDTLSWPLEHQIVWHTSVHAWNIAVQLNVSQVGGLGANLPNGASVGPYHGFVPDMLLPVEQVGDGVYCGDVPYQGFVLSVGWHPAQLRWADVREAVKATQETRLQLQEAIALGQPDATRGAIDDHVRAVSGHLVRQTMPRVPRLPGILWTFATGVAGYYFEPGSAQHLAAKAVATTGFVGIGGASVVNAMQRRAIAYTLRTVASDIVRQEQLSMPSTSLASHGLAAQRAT